MNKEQLQNEIDKLQKQLDDYDSKGWKPEKFKKYYFVDDSYIGSWNCNADNVDNFRFSQGNCFKTLEEVSQHRENLVTRGELYLMSLEYPVDWENEDAWKYYFHFGSNVLSTGYSDIFRNQGIIYLTREGIGKAREQIGEERLIKLIKSGV